MRKDATTAQQSLRGSEDLWIEAAYQILVDAGVEAVKILSLAKKLNLSRTSFYWHFEDRDALLAALIRRWREKNTGGLVTQTEKYAETIAEAVFNLFDCWVDTEIFDARLDFAIRNWAQHTPTLKSTLQASDLERVEAIRAMFARFDFSEAQAETRAKTAYHTQIGYYSIVSEEALEERLQRMPYYVEIFTGAPPTPAETARFFSRHQDPARRRLASGAR